MSTTAVAAGQIMDRVAQLLNDPLKTDYTYDVILPYLNMAIEELSENIEDAQNSPGNQTAVVILVPVGKFHIDGAENLLVDPTAIVYPDDLMEIQEIGERAAGTQDPFVRMTRLEFTPHYTPSNALMYWCWENQTIKFNTAGPIPPSGNVGPSGALTDREVQLRYLKQAIPYVANANSIISIINSRSYLSYRTAALCAMFIGENESRAKVLNDQSDDALERMQSINNKGRQQIMTRHRPFRAAYKSRGWM